MNFDDANFLLAAFVSSLLVVMISIEAGYRLGRRAHRRSADEKESPISAIEGSVLALLAFFLAFTFQIASNRFDARKELVRQEANTIRTAWHRSDFLPEADRGEAKRLLREYVAARVSAFQSAEAERVKQILDDAEKIQNSLWDMAVTNARRDMNSDVAALYIQSLNELSAVHASRVAVALQMRIPPGIWVTLAVLTSLGMIMVGYQTAVAESKRTLAMPILAVAFALVVTLIGSLDHPLAGFTLTAVSQQPLIDLLADIEEQRLATPLNRPGARH